MSLRSVDYTPAFPISRLVLVGVCASGKSTLSRRLDERGIEARPVAQEHSGVQDLYRRQGSLVILLAASWQTVHRRRKLSWDPQFYGVEWLRLRQARQDARLIVHTDSLSPDQVADVVTEWFDQWFGLDRWWRESGVEEAEKPRLPRQLADRAESRKV